MSITNQQLLNLVACVGTALEKADESRKNASALHEKVASAIPAAHKALVRSGLVESHEADELSRVLNDHATLVHFVTKLANHYATTLTEVQQAPVTPMGRPHEEQRVKQASYRYPGQRSTGPTEADLAFLEKVTGHRPE